MGSLNTICLPFTCQAAHSGILLQYFIAKPTFHIRYCHTNSFALDHLHIASWFSTAYIRGIASLFYLCRDYTLDVNNLTGAHHGFINLLPIQYANLLLARLNGAIILPAGQHMNHHLPAGISHQLADLYQQVSNDQQHSVIFEQNDWTIVVMYRNKCRIISFCYM